MELICSSNMNRHILKKLCPKNCTKVSEAFADRKNRSLTIDDIISKVLPECGNYKRMNAFWADPGGYKEVQMYNPCSAVECGNYSTQRLRNCRNVQKAIDSPAATIDMRVGDVISQVIESCSDYRGSIDEISPTIDSHTFGINTGECSKEAAEKIVKEFVKRLEESKGSKESIRVVCEDSGCGHFSLGVEGHCKRAVSIFRSNIDTSKNTQVWDFINNFILGCDNRQTSVSILVLATDSKEHKAGSIKFDEGKLRMSLIPVDSLIAIAEVFTKGAIKHGVHSWTKGDNWSVVYDAALRHLNAFWAGEDRDPEINTLHLANAIVNLMFLIRFMKTHPQLDDRIKLEATDEIGRG